MPDEVGAAHDGGVMAIEPEASGGADPAGDGAVADELEVALLADFVFQFERDVDSILRPSLPPPIIERLHASFGHLKGVGLDRPGPVKK